jgi:HAD superfamily hydrolase (TIGR01509 family)
MNPERFVLSPGAKDLLEALTVRNIPRTIATSSEITNVTFFVEHLGLNRWFDTAKIVYDDGHLPGKPAPDFYLAAAKRIGFDPSQCIAVEDAISGIASAYAAGIGFLVALGESATHPRLLSCPGVALVIDSLTDFPEERLLAAR